MFFRRRYFLALILGLAVASVSFIIHTQYAVANDIELPLCGAARILAGFNPYTTCETYGQATYPLPTLLVLTPLAWLTPAAAGAVFMGLSTALLAIALNREGEPWRLLAFVSVPFIYAVQMNQWAPLFLAAAYLRWLYPLVIIKPQLGLPVGILRFEWRGVVAALALLGLSFVIMPGWVGTWLDQARTYGGYIPLLVWPVGPVLLLALRRWRTEAAGWLLLLSCMPQRSWYDQLMLWVIPTSAGQTVILTACSWLMWLPTLVWGREATEAWQVVLQVSMLYLPALAMVLTAKEGGLRLHTVTQRVSNVGSLFVGRRDL